MLKSTLPFSKARARCWAGTPVSESYLWVGLGWVEFPQRAAGSLRKGSGALSGEFREHPPPKPYQWKSGPRFPGGATKRASRKHSWL